MRSGCCERNKSAPGEPHTQRAAAYCHLSISKCGTKERDYEDCYLGIAFRDDDGSHYKQRKTSLSAPERSGAATEYRRSNTSTPLSTNWRRRNGGHASITTSSEACDQAAFPGSSFGRRCYFCAALHFAHLALVAALIRAKPAGEMRRRLGAIETTFRCPFTLAQRALWAAAILARAAYWLSHSAFLRAGRL